MTRNPIATTIPFSDPDAFEDTYTEPETDDADSLDIGPQPCRHNFVTSCGETVCIHMREGGLAMIKDIPIIFSVRKQTEFESLVIPEPNSGCHIFIGKLNSKGYGRFSHGRFGLRPAHQVALDMAGRPRPFKAIELEDEPDFEYAQEILDMAKRAGPNSPWCKKPD